MYFTVRNILDWRDRQFQAARGHLTFRLFEDGWMIRFTPFNGKSEAVEGLDILTACRFANDRLD